MQSFRVDTTLPPELFDAINRMDVVSLAAWSASRQGGKKKKKGGAKKK